jgi:hypothetical protein
LNTQIKPWSNLSNPSFFWQEVSINSKRYIYFSSYVNTVVPQYFMLLLPDVTKSCIWTPDLSLLAFQTHWRKQLLSILGEYLLGETAEYHENLQATEWASRTGIHLKTFNHETSDRRSSTMFSQPN